MLRTSLSRGFRSSRRPPTCGRHAEERVLHWRPNQLGLQAGVPWNRMQSLSSASTSCSARGEQAMAAAGGAGSPAHPGARQLLNGRSSLFQWVMWWGCCNLQRHDGFEMQPPAHLQNTSAEVSTTSDPPSCGTSTGASIGCRATVNGPSWLGSGAPCAISASTRRSAAAASCGRRARVSSTSLRDGRRHSGVPCTCK